MKNLVEGNIQDIKSNQEILKSILFFNTKNEDWVNSLKKELSKLDLKGLENLAIVNIETTGEGKQGLYGLGLRQIQDILRVNPNRKILIYAFTSLKTLEKDEPSIQALLVKGNVKFIEFPFSPKDITTVMNQDNIVNSEEIRNANSALEREINLKVGSLLHRISNVWSHDDIEKADRAQLDIVIKEAKEYFPILAEKTEKDILEFLFKTRQGVPKPMEGLFLEGVYCDVEGTIIIDRKINQKVLNLLKQYETQGKKITLWTDGDISQLGSLLTSLGVNYELKNKIDFAGAQAEIIIDNDDENTFFTKTRILAKKFVFVEKL